MAGLKCNGRETGDEDIRIEDSLITLVIDNLNSSFSYLDYN